MKPKKNDIKMLIFDKKTRINQGYADCFGYYINETAALIKEKTGKAPRVFEMLARALNLFYEGIKGGYIEYDEIKNSN